MATAEQLERSRERVPSSNWTAGILGLLVVATVLSYKNTADRDNGYMNSAHKQKNTPTATQPKQPPNQLDDRLWLEKMHQEQVRWSHMTPHQRRVALELKAVTPEVIMAWEPQHEREDNPWHAENGKFSGGLNIMYGSWTQFGGEDFAHTPAQASVQEQIVVGRRIQASVGVYTAPDPNDGNPGW